MNILIDPYVFCQAFKDHICTQTTKTLTDLEQDKAKFCFVLTNDLKKSYGAYIQQRPAKVHVQLAQTIARHLVNGTGFKSITIEISREHPLPAGVQEHILNCDLDKMDQHLLQIVIERCNSRTITEIGPAIVLLLACSGFERRCLQQKSFRNALCEAIQGLIVHCVEDSASIKQHIIDPQKLTNDQQHDARFEDQCALWLGRRLELGCYTGVERWGCEIDIFCEVCEGGTHRFYLGECKLVHNESDGQEKLEKALEQLRERVKAGKGVEHEAQGVEHEAQWECFVFCNADFSPDILEKANRLEQETGATIHLVRVTMPSRWQKTPNWKLQDKDFCEIKS